MALVVGPSPKTRLQLGELEESMMWWAPVVLDKWELRVSTVAGRCGIRCALGYDGEGHGLGIHLREAPDPPAGPSDLEEAFNKLDLLKRYLDARFNWSSEAGFMHVIQIPQMAGAGISVNEESAPYWARDGRFAWIPGRVRCTVGGYGRPYGYRHLIKGAWSREHGSSLEVQSPRCEPFFRLGEVPDER